MANNTALKSSHQFHDQIIDGLFENLVEALYRESWNENPHIPPVKMYLKYWEHMNNQISTLQEAGRMSQSKE